MTALSGRSPYPGVRYRVQLPYETAAKVETLLANTASGKRHYGALSKLVTKLLNQYFENLEHQHKLPHVAPTPPIITHAERTATEGVAT